MQAHTTPFGRTLATLLVEKGYVRKNSNPDWTRFSSVARGVSYETLRKAVTGERTVSAGLMECVAKALQTEPEVFLEYKLDRVRRAFDPDQVGWERATETLREWEAHTEEL